MNTTDKRHPWSVWALVALVIALWMFDPVAWRVRLRYAPATVTDCRDYFWLLPGILHSRVPEANNLYDDTYLHIELSDHTVDLSQFRDVPFFLLVLNHCILTDLRPIDDMNLGNRSISFKDCDLSAVPPSQHGEIADLKHSTYRIGGP